MMNLEFANRQGKRLEKRKPNNSRKKRRRSEEKIRNRKITNSIHAVNMNMNMNMNRESRQSHA